MWYLKNLSIDSVQKKKLLKSWMHQFELAKRTPPPKKRKKIKAGTILILNFVKTI